MLKYNCVNCKDLFCKKRNKENAKNCSCGSHKKKYESIFVWIIMEERLDELPWPYLVCTTEKIAKKEVIELKRKDLESDLTYNIYNIVRKKLI